MTTARNMYELGFAEKYLPEKPWCVMLDTDNPLFYPDWMDMKIFQQNLYVDENSTYKNGITTDHHVTNRYGILPSVDRKDILSLLERWSPHNPLTPTRTMQGSFQVLGPPGAEYEAVVVPIEVNSFLASVHQELGALPNVATFPYYQPHITIGYFKYGFWRDLDPQLWPPVKQEIGTKGFRLTGPDI